MSEVLESLGRYSAEVDRLLGLFLRSKSPAIPNLQDAAIYALGLDLEDAQARGKRIRPALCLLTCESLDGNPQAALPFRFIFPSAAGISNA